MSKHPDGSTISSYFGLKKADTGQDVKNQGSKTLVGQIAKVHYIDDSTNVSKLFVEYDVVVRDERGGQSTFKNVRCESTLGGFNDQEETVLEPSEVAFSGELNSGNLFSNKNGALVYVSFRDGSLDKPYIEGCIPHPKKPGAKRADGIRKLGEFRGIEWGINKDGELTITYRGNRNPNGTLVRGATGPTVVKIDKTGAFSISDNSGQSFKIDRVAKTISFSNGVTVTFNGTGDKFSVTTKGGAQMSVDGTSDTISLKDKANGALKISAGKVALGSPSAELLQQISDQLAALQTLFSTVSSHTHIGNLGFPTAPPSTAGDWSSAASEMGSIKGKIDGIKGSL